MLKKIVLCVLSLGVIGQAQAFDKSQVNLSKDFFGTWTVYSAKTQCTETYQFTQPGQFVYTTKQKRMTGEFAVVRNQDAKILDWLAMDVKTDNKKAGCSGQANDYTGTKINLVLKWISPKTAELCLDREAKQCTGLYQIKQK